MSKVSPPPIDSMLREDAWRHHRSWLKRLAASLVVDAARADDLTQQALLAALERPPADSTQPRAWLATVARNLARRFAIGERRRVAREQVAALHERLPATDEVVARAALQVDVSIAVLALEEPYRSVLLLRFFEDLPPRAIAKRLGIPVATVRTRVLRGVEQLRERLIARRGADGSRRDPALGLVALLDGAARRGVRRALLAKSASGGAAIVGGSAVATLGLLGVLGMSTKLKLVAAAIMLAAGTFAVVQLVESPVVPPRSHSASAATAPPALPAPATIDASRLPTAAEATRAAEARDVGKPPSDAPATPPPPAKGEIAGIVRTARGDPAAGALVLLERAGGSARFGSLADLCAGAGELLKTTGAATDVPGDSKSEAAGEALQTLSGGDGRFRFEESPFGDCVNVAAIHREEGVALVTGLVVDGSSAARSVELVLAAGVVLHGSVTGEQGEPIAGVSVDVSRFSRSSDGSSSTSSSLLSLAADEQGRFRTIPLPFDGFRVSARAAGWFHAGQVAFPIAPDERERLVDLRLTHAPTWRGRVVSGDGSPARLAGVGIHLDVVASADDPSGDFTFPDSGGDRGTLAIAEDRYEVTPVEPDRRFVSIWGGGVLLGFAEVAPPDVARDVVVDLAKLPPPKAIGSLAIVVVDARTGAPLPDFHFGLTGDPLSLAEPNAREESRQVSDPQGRVAIDRLLAGDYDVNVRAAGYAPLFANLRVAGASASSSAVPAAPVQLALRPATARVEGRVEDENGQPVPAASVFLLNVDGTAALPFPEHRVLSGDDGRFVFPDLGEGDYVVVASRDEFVPPRPDGGAFAPASSPAKASSDAGAGHAPVVVRVWRGFEVAIDPRCDGKSLSGPFSFRIRDERGVAVHDHHHPGSITQMSGSGFRFRLAPGDYTVELFSPRFAPNRTKFRAAPDATVVVELEPLAAAR